MLAACTLRQGLTGLAAAVLGAEEVMLTDQAQILFLAQENIDRNRAAMGQGRYVPRPVQAQLACVCCHAC